MHPEFFNQYTGYIKPNEIRNTATENEGKNTYSGVSLHLHDLRFQCPCDWLSFPSQFTKSQNNLKVSLPDILKTQGKDQKEARVTHHWNKVIDLQYRDERKRKFISTKAYWDSPKYPGVLIASQLLQERFQSSTLTEPRGHSCTSKSVKHRHLLRWTHLNTSWFNSPGFLCQKNQTILQKHGPPTSGSILLLLLSRGKRQNKHFWEVRFQTLKILQWNFPLKLSFANNEVIFKNKVLAVTLGWQSMSSEKSVGDYQNGKEVLKVPNRQNLSEGVNICLVSREYIFICNGIICTCLYAWNIHNKKF